MNHLDPDMDIPEDSGQPDDTQKRIGRFVIDRLVGRGGMGEVYRAWDPDNNRTVALKVLDVKGYEDPDTLKRFQRESEAALVLDHINIARFYGAEKDDEQRPIIAMEFIEGRGLDEILADDGEIPFSQLVDYVIQTARGLENAYRRSIIHRDIKPGNLIVDREEQLKIIDFGLAKSMWDNSGLTNSGLVVGTPRYISPEQGMGRNVDHRSDIYSLGATFYELVTGRTPFEGDAPLAIMMKHINAPLMPPYLINPRVPADISDIIIKMMAKEPSHRYQDYEPLIRDLETAKIQRLAKERRTPGEMSGMRTVILPENELGAGTETPAASYLTEGLVSVELPKTEEVPPSHAKTILLSIAGLVVLAFTILLLMKPTYMDNGKSSSFGQRIAGMLLSAKEKIEPEPTASEVAKEDLAKIETTRARMDAVVNKLLNMRSASGNDGIPTISQLRSKEIFTKDQTSDAWGNDFFITDSSVGGTLVALGRDGRENTDDDFLLSLDGSEQVIPEALSPDKDALSSQE